MNHPIVTLKNGIRVCNFSSPHPFTFDDGTVLPACPPEVSKALSLNTDEQPVPHPSGKWTDIILSFGINTQVSDALWPLTMNDSIDIILVPFPVMQAIKEEGFPPKKCRVIRMADRVTKTVCSDKFCI